MKIQSPLDKVRTVLATRKLWEEIEEDKFEISESPAQKKLINAIFGEKDGQVSDERK